MYIYWCDLPLDNPNQSIERITRVLLAFSPSSKQGKEIWANLTGGNNVINSTLFLLGYLSGKISRYYYINAQFPNNRFLRPYFTKEKVNPGYDQYWVSFPNIKISFDEPYYAILEEIMTNPKAPFSSQELLNILKNSPHNEYFNHFNDSTVFGKIILLPMIGSLLDREIYEIEGKLKVSDYGKTIYQMISDDMIKRLIFPTVEKGDEAGRQNALLNTGWFFKERIK